MLPDLNINFWTIESNPNRNILDTHKYPDYNYFVDIQIIIIYLNMLFFLVSKHIENTQKYLKLSSVL